MYLLWFDNDFRRPVASKVAEAAARYRKKFREEPTVCLCNERDIAADSPVPMQAHDGIGHNCFWIGKPESE